MAEDEAQSGGTPTGSHSASAGPSWIRAFGSVLTARVMASAAAFTCIALIARSLGPAGFSTFAILLSLMKVASEFVGPALDTGLVRFGARHLGRDGALTKEALPYFRIMFRTKAILALILIVVGIVGAGPIRALFFETNGATETGAVSSFAVTLALLGASAIVMWAYVQAYFQAGQQFTRYALSDLSNATLRLILVGLWLVAAHVLGAGTPSVTIFLALFVVPQAVMAVAASCWLPFAQIAGPDRGGGFPGAGVGKGLFHFTKWVLAACCFTALGQRLDLFLMAYLRIAGEVIGRYGAAVQLVVLGDMLIMTLFSVLLPEASKLTTARDTAAFLAKFRVPMVLLFLAMAPVFALAAPFSRLVFGPVYSDTGRLVAILLVGTVFTVGCAPAGTVLYGLGRSHVIALLEGAKLVGIFAVGWCLVPRYGAFGMAWTVAAIKGTIGVATYVAARREVARRR